MQDAVFDNPNITQIMFCFFYSKSKDSTFLGDLLSGRDLDEKIDATLYPSIY